MSASFDWQSFDTIEPIIWFGQPKFGSKEAGLDCFCDVSAVFETDR